MLEKEKLKEALAAHKTPQTLQEILNEVEEAIQAGNSKHAYELSLEATQAAPHDASVWLLRASLAPTLEERVLCVNRLNELDPNYQDRHAVAFFALKDLLDEDPHLAYLEESEELYRVLQPDRRVLSIPKKRSPAPPPPYERKDELKAAHRWLAFATLGLMFAGVLTLIFAPLAALSAIRTGRFIGSHPVQVRSAIVVLTASVLFVIGLFFSFLLVLHLVG